eukprot:2917704-Pyramimonas_sp.AAC.1
MHTCIHTHIPGGEARGPQNSCLDSPWAGRGAPACSEDPVGDGPWPAPERARRAPGSTVIQAVAK